MNKRKSLNKIRIRRKLRTRASIFGTAEKPRLSVLRSNRNLHIQLIDDVNKKTVASASTVKLSSNKKNKTQQAEAAAEILLQKMKELGVKEAVFDRGMYKYHGRIKAVADTLRKNGLKI